MFYGYVVVRNTSYPKSSYPLDIIYVAFLLNGPYLFIWDVTVEFLNKFTKTLKLNWKRWINYVFYTISQLL